MDCMKILREFHETYGVPVNDVPQLIPDRLQLRLDLITEEVDELQYAAAQDDLVEMADALGDIVYVCFGMALEIGIDLNDVLAKIHRANMSKLGADGKPIINGMSPGATLHDDPLYRSDQPHGKVLKGPNYLPPDIAAVIFF